VIGVIGIDTNVGKTVVSAILIEALQGYYWKPIQCGLPKDSEWIGGKCVPERYMFKTPCSPHLAARIEGVEIDVGALRPPQVPGALIVEGVGGVMAPLTPSKTFLDVVDQWKAEWVLVHRHYLGSLNHFLLTLEALQHREMLLKGVVFNGEGDLETEKMLLNKARTQCIGRIAWQQELTKQFIRETAEEWKQRL
jgi:dethiobiotin synthetase